MDLQLIEFNTELYLLLLFVFLLLSFIAQLLTFLLLNKKIDNYSSININNNQEFEKNTVEMSHISDICNSLEERMYRFEKNLHCVEEKTISYQDAVESSNEVLDAKIYSRALKMIKLGAEKEDIMRDCELPEAEVDLLCSLHAVKS